MKVNRNRIIYSSEPFGRFLLEALAMVTKKGIEVPNPDEYDVTMTINGVDVPVEELFIYWHDKLESRTEERANKLFLNKFKDVKGVFSTLCDTINDKVDEARVQVVSELDIWDEFESNDLWY